MMWCEVTHLDASLGREIHMTVVMPDIGEMNTSPIDACLFIAEKSRESDSMMRFSSLEEICRREKMAAVCVPGWLAYWNSENGVTGEQWLKETLPDVIASYFPLRIRWQSDGSDRAN